MSCAKFQTHGSKIQDRNFFFALAFWSKINKFLVQSVKKGGENSQNPQNLYYYIKFKIKNLLVGAKNNYY